jgi:hypothetical protein
MAKSFRPLVAVIDDRLVLRLAHETANFRERSALFGNGATGRCEGSTVDVDGKREAAIPDPGDPAGRPVRRLAVRPQRRIVPAIKVRFARRSARANDQIVVRRNPNLQNGIRCGLDAPEANEARFLAGRSPVNDCRPCASGAGVLVNVWPSSESL